MRVHETVRFTRQWRENDDDARGYIDGGPQTAKQEGRDGISNMNLCMMYGRSVMSAPKC